MNTPIYSGMDDVTLGIINHSETTSPDGFRKQNEIVPSRDILCYIRERDNARAETSRVKTELDATRVKMYDMVKRLEQLEPQVALHNANRSPCKSAKKKKVPVKADNLTLPNDHRIPSSPRKGLSSRRSPTRTPSPSPSHNRGKTGHKTRRKKPVTIENNDPNSHAFYRSIADRFPTMSLATALNAEEKFKAADINQDGAIDRDELDTVLMANSLLLTPNQLKAILTEVGVDNRNSIDFEEVLTVLDKIDKSRRITPVLADIHRKKSQICVIQ